MVSDGLVTLETELSLKSSGMATVEDTNLCCPTHELPCKAGRTTTKKKGLSIFSHPFGL